MEFITGKHIPRRTFLRTAGVATVGLPFLDAMAPAGRLWAKTAAEIDRTRLICIENSNGVRRKQPVGRHAEPLGPRRCGSPLRLEPERRTGSPRAVPGLPDDHQQHRRAHGGAVPGV